MPQLLMIAYYFPPLGGAGVQRAAKFAKYLSRSGWCIHVISAASPPFEVLDPSLEKEIFSDMIKVYRVNAGERFRGLDFLPGGWRLRAFCQKWFLFPDRMSGWIKPALKVAEEVCAQNPGIPIFTTSAPYAAHLIGFALKKKIHSVWAADFRDEWTQNPYLEFPTPFHRQKHLQAEQRVLENADLVISVTEKITAGLKKNAPDSAAHFVTIPNGFDPEDFAGLVKVRPPFFTITHIGTLNQERAKLLKILFSTLKGLIEAKIIPVTDVKLRLIGAEIHSAHDFTGLEWVEVSGYLPHHRALEVMANSSLLILAESNPAAYTGKIFEYLGLKIPIMGLVHPDSPAASLIEKARAGWVIGLNNITGIKEVLMQCYQAWRGGNVCVNPEVEVIAEFNRELQAGRLAELITGVPGYE